MALEMVTPVMLAPSADIARDMKKNATITLNAAVP